MEEDIDDEMLNVLLTGWYAGMDTMDIAERINLPESRVYNMLASMMAYRHEWKDW